MIFMKIQNTIKKQIYETKTVNINLTKTQDLMHLSTKTNKNK